MAVRAEMGDTRWSGPGSGSCSQAQAACPSGGQAVWLQRVSWSTLGPLRAEVGRKKLRYAPRSPVLALHEEGWLGMRGWQGSLAGTGHMGPLGNCRHEQGLGSWEEGAGLNVPRHKMNRWQVVAKETKGGRASHD